MDGTFAPFEMPAPAPEPNYDGVANALQTARLSVGQRALVLIVTAVEFERFAGAL